MMPTGQIFWRVIAYGLVLSAVDAASGRMLQASPDPSIVLSLGGVAWVAYRLAEGRQARLAVAAGLALWFAFIVGFVLWARLLVGWNGSVPWQPRSPLWMVNFVIAVPVVAVLAQWAGSRAAARAALKTARPTPNASA
jgi:hypothetical protein